MAITVLHRVLQPSSRLSDMRRRGSIGRRYDSGWSERLRGQDSGGRGEDRLCQCLELLAESTRW